MEKRQSYNIDGKPVKSVKLTSLFASDYGHTSLEPGDLFWEGDVVLHTNFASKYGQDAFSPVSGIVSHVRVSKGSGGYVKATLEYVEIAEFPEIQPPQNPRPYFSLSDGTYLIKGRLNEGQYQKIEFWISDQRQAQNRDGEKFFVVEEIVESGEVVSRGQPLFFYFSTQPTKKQLECWKSQNEIPELSKVFSSLKREVEDLKIERNAIVQGIKNTKEEAVIEVQRLSSLAETDAQKIVGAAKERSQELLDVALLEAERERQSINDNASKLSLGAILSRLYELQANGELPELMDRLAMRRLYVALGEMLGESQGFAAPETLAQMENQNRMDEIRAMNYALAKQIRDAEADEFLPDVVRQRMIEQLLDMTEAKGGSIVKKAVDDG